MREARLFSRFCQLEIFFNLFSGWESSARDFTAPLMKTQSTQRWNNTFWKSKTLLSKAVSFGEVCFLCHKKSARPSYAKWNKQQCGHCCSRYPKAPTIAETQLCFPAWKTLLKVAGKLRDEPSCPLPDISLRCLRYTLRYTPSVNRLLCPTQFLPIVQSPKECLACFTRSLEYNTLLSNICREAMKY